MHEWFICYSFIFMKGLLHSSSVNNVSQDVWKENLENIGLEDTIYTDMDLKCFFLCCWTLLHDENINPLKRNSILHLYKSNKKVNMITFATLFFHYCEDCLTNFFPSMNRHTYSKKLMLADAVQHPIVFWTEQLT